MSEDWTEKYRPRSLSGVVGNPKAVGELRKWADSWSTGIPKNRAVILMGPPGVGKTTSAEALAADMGWGIVEMNSSDQRTGEAIRSVALRGAFAQTFGDDGEFRSTADGGRKLIVLDEADSLFGNAYTDWENITYANLTSAADAENHIDYSFIVDAYNNSSTEYYNSTSQSDKRYAYSPSFSADTADWSILEKWYSTSMYLYSLDFSEVELTLDYVGYGEYFMFDFDHETFPQMGRYLYYATGDDNERSKLLNDLGYTDLSELVYSGFVQNYLWQFLIESAEDFIAYNGDFDGVIADLEAMKAELDAAVDGENDNVKAIYEQIYALTQQLADFNEQIRGQYAVIDSIDVEIQKLIGSTNSEKSVLEGKIYRIENTIGILEGIINGCEIEIGGYIYNPLTDGLEEIHTAYIDDLEYQIDQYELDLQEAQDYLDRLLAAEDPFKQALEDAERALANAQEAYEKLLEEFNYYNELLNDFLTNVLGIGNDDNPEA